MVIISPLLYWFPTPQFKLPALIEKFTFDFAYFLIFKKSKNKSFYHLSNRFIEKLTPIMFPWPILSLTKALNQNALKEYQGVC